MMLTLFIALPVAAAQAVADERSCADPMDQQTMTACAVLDFERAAEELDRQFERTLADMAATDREIEAGGGAGDAMPTYAEALQESQRAWLAYRDAQCAFEGYEMRGGSGERMVVAHCLASLTRARAESLGELWGE